VADAKTYRWNGDTVVCNSGEALKERAKALYGAAPARIEAYCRDCIVAPFDSPRMAICQCGKTLDETR
jgi:hypothetical protein